MFKMLDLYPELQLDIVTYLPPEEVKELALCCKRLNHLLQPLIWECKKIPYKRLTEPFNRTLVGLCKEIWLYYDNVHVKSSLAEVALEEKEDKMAEGLNMLFSSFDPCIFHMKYHPVLLQTNFVISRLDRLTELYLKKGRNGSFSDEDISRISSYCVPKLKVLSVRNPYNTDEAFVNIGRLTCLEKLEIIQSDITDAVVKSIKSQQLKYVDFEGCDFLTNIAVQRLSLFSNLQHLNLRSCNINDKGVEYLKEIKNLQELDLSFHDHVTDTSLKHISCLSELQKLNVSYTEVSDNGLQYLQTLAKLSVLHLSNCDQITGRTVTCLCKLPLTSLYLDSTGISDQDLKDFKLFHLLKYLNLSECFNISDDGVPYIVESDSLQELEIECIPLSEDGFGYLKEGLPNVLIHSDFEYDEECGVAYYVGVV